MFFFYNSFTVVLFTALVGIVLSFVDHVFSSHSKKQLIENSYVSQMMGFLSEHDLFAQGFAF